MNPGRYQAALGVDGPGVGTCQCLNQDAGSERDYLVTSRCYGLCPRTFRCSCPNTSTDDDKVRLHLIGIRRWGTT